jgi:hypothetical protein
MHLCYLDESGCTGALKSKTDTVQPVFILCGLFLPAHDLSKLTNDFIALKHRFYPAGNGGRRARLDDVLREIKGADIRRYIRENQRTQSRQAVAFLHKMIDLLEQAQAKFVARVYIKGIGQTIDGTAMYTAAAQQIVSNFQDYLTANNSRGIVIADCRSKATNVQVSHSIFTQKFKNDGDRFNRVLELPLFGNSDNHAALQVCDLLCSAILFPIASYSYCLGHIESMHIHAEYRQIKQKYGPRLIPLQHRYNDMSDRPVGGVTVSDHLMRRSSSVMFR